MRKNAEMETLLEGVGDISGIALSPSIAEILSDGYVERGDAVLCRHLAEKAKAVSRADFPDLTGYECFVNHAHVDDYLTDDPDRIALLRQGLLLAYRISSDLRHLFSDRDFNVILSSDEESCAVRFHVVREDESWLCSDLEKYELEALLVLNTADRSSNASHDSEGV